MASIAQCNPCKAESSSISLRLVMQVAQVRCPRQEQVAKSDTHLWTFFNMVVNEVMTGHRAPSVTICIKML